MLAIPLPHSFLKTYCLSTSSLRSKAFCIVFNFFVISSISLSSSLVHLKNSPEYPTRRNAQVFIPLIRFLLLGLFSRYFLNCLWYAFKKNFLLLLLVWWCSLPRFPSTCKFPFLQVFWFFLNLVVLILPLFVFSPFHDEHGTFFNAKFHSYILAVYCYCFYPYLHFFFILLLLLLWLFSHQNQHIFQCQIPFLYPGCIFFFFFFFESSSHQR